MSPRSATSSVSFAQPSLLVGDRAALGQPRAPRRGLGDAPARPGDARWCRAACGPIDARDVAAALIAATLAGKPGVHHLSSARMQGARQR